MIILEDGRSYFAPIKLEVIPTEVMCYELTADVIKAMSQEAVEQFQESIEHLGDLIAEDLEGRG